MNRSARTKMRDLKASEDVILLSTIRTHVNLVHVFPEPGTRSFSPYRGSRPSRVKHLYRAVTTTSCVVSSRRRPTVLSLLHVFYKKIKYNRPNVNGTSCTYDMHCHDRK